ncbi:flagellar hook-length control protein FliK [Gymnodinialimonas hymeniacidonis]|uniref:flagellar hook-length control protein FliK n=1 Tax=Gymnodinialimonas hymeniacidonis TaxID=3126508 RepID=UPI0034C6574C
MDDLFQNLITINRGQANVAGPNGTGGPSPEVPFLAVFGASDVLEGAEGLDPRTPPHVIANEDDTPMGPPSFEAALPTESIARPPVLTDAGYSEPLQPLQILTPSASSSLKEQPAPDQSAVRNQSVLTTTFVQAMPHPVGRPAQKTAFSMAQSTSHLPILSIPSVPAVPQAVGATAIETPVSTEPMIKANGPLLLADQPAHTFPTSGSSSAGTLVQLPLGQGSAGNAPENDAQPRLAANTEPHANAEPPARHATPPNAAASGQSTHLDQAPVGLPDGLRAVSPQPQTIPNYPTGVPQAGVSASQRTDRPKPDQVAFLSPTMPNANLPMARSAVAAIPLATAPSVEPETLTPHVLPPSDPPQVHDDVQAPPQTSGRAAEAANVPLQMARATTFPMMWQAATPGAQFAASPGALDFETALDLEPQMVAQNAPLNANHSTALTPISLNGTGPAPTLVAQQIAAALQDHSQERGQPIELALDPPELGRVRMQLVELAGIMTLTIHAERPETAELMRRHMDLLTQEFAGAGIEAPSVHISQDGSGAQSDEPDHADQGENSPTETDAPSPETPETRTRNAAGTLDLRL